MIDHQQPNGRASDARRRSVLHGLAAVAGVAGCLGDGGGSGTATDSETTTATGVTPTPESGTGPRRITATPTATGPRSVVVIEYGDDFTGAVVGERDGEEVVYRSVSGDAGARVVLRERLDLIVVRFDSDAGQAGSITVRHGGETIGTRTITKEDTDFEWALSTTGTPAPE